jgi:hypothetical protein
MKRRIPERAPRNGAPERAPRNDVLERAPRNDVPERAPGNGMPEKGVLGTMCREGLGAPNSDHLHLLSLRSISRLGLCSSNTLSTLPLSLLETAALSLTSDNEQRESNR